VRFCLTRHNRRLNPRLSTSVTYALLSLKLLEHRARNSCLKKKKSTYRTTCVTCFSILIRACANEWHIIYWFSKMYITKFHLYIQKHLFTLRNVEICVFSWHETLQIGNNHTNFNVTTILDSLSRCKGNISLSRNPFSINNCLVYNSYIL
jgi:hypothetical protein